MTKGSRHVHTGVSYVHLCWVVLQHTLCQFTVLSLTFCILPVKFVFAAGVRYPAHLLHLVVATLSSIQTLMPPQPQLKQPTAATELSGSTALQEQALKAAAMGAGGALRTEPVSPIDKRSLAKAFRYKSISVRCHTQTLPVYQRLTAPGAKSAVEVVLPLCGNSLKTLYLPLVHADRPRLC